MAREISAKDLGIDVEKGEGELFKWFVASFLFGKRIQRDIAAEAYRVIVDKHRRDTPRKLGHCSWRELVNMSERRVTFAMTSRLPSDCSSCATHSTVNTTASSAHCVSRARTVRSWKSAWRRSKASGRKRWRSACARRRRSGSDRTIGGTKGNANHRAQTLIACVAHPAQRHPADSLFRWDDAA